jgi:5-amino-6-(5-phospho-D-ribitylamino)uracil phosphatase
MKTLYISDLDGTLFNKKKEISDFTIYIINRFIEKGGLFTIATARTAYGCDYKLDKININVAAILMNGVFLYDFVNKKYIDVHIIDYDKVIEIEKVFDKHKNCGFMYTYEDNRISIFYKDDEDLKHTQYFSDRAKEECSQISKTDSFARQAKTKDAVYFALTGEENEVKAIWEEIKKIEGVGSACYLNVYNGLYCLEAFDSKASKASALKKLKDIVKADEVIVFGDNHNDISMMEVADKSYAPDNAVEEVKEIVDGILEGCDYDGVAKFLKDKYHIRNIKIQSSTRFRI